MNVQAFRIIYEKLDDEVVLIRDFLKWQGFDVVALQDEERTAQLSKGKGTPVVCRGVDMVAVGFMDTVKFLERTGMTRC